MYSLRTQLGGAGRQTGERLTLHPPAKVNLTLEILARRPDGFHELETLMLAVSVCDTLICEPTDDSKLHVRCQWAAGLLAQSIEIWQPLPATNDNLVWKALERLRIAAGVTRGVRVDVIKRIPAQAGLGGASADAAAALLAANAVWQLHWPIERLAEVAAQLGSDVPFFLTGGAAVCRGRGEQIEVVRAPRCSLVIVRPPTGLSTPAVFKRCQPSSPRQAASDMLRDFARGDSAAAARALHNGLQQPAEQLSPWISKLRRAFETTGCLGHQMSGSGSSYFGLCWHVGQAKRIARRLRSMNLGAVMVAETVSTTLQAAAKASQQV
ncbi:4-(cytidine 5'-diphospho)-2-C-methyl-D-erythritol kinase [Anatilimnocola floriformis]|uniref:4-(cytidine 5'-diphospho)-2-C-methyl-D-erythritol kinase n=1 Tax=Anatilimnocola floriformis TaxID=2948575 RepID=UPI0020C29F6F|nr:4-(cytidine 5'-diphospho)-2-C-methyl-D-erythritol kinase [Anatilimnocola floriformis]